MMPITGPAIRGIKRPEPEISRPYPLPSFPRKAGIQRAEDHDPCPLPPLSRRRRELLPRGSHSSAGLVCGGPDLALGGVEYARHDYKEQHDLEPGAVPRLEIG